MLKGESIILRTVSQDDLDYLYSAHSDISNRGNYFPISVRSERDFWRLFEESGFWGKNEGMLVIIDKKSNIVGHIEYFKTVPYLDELELSYQLYSEKEWGKGFTSQAVALFVNYLFRQRRENRIRLVIHPANKGSIRVAEKCGFAYEGTARGSWFHEGKSQDTAIYSILRDEALNR